MLRLAALALVACSGECFQHALILKGLHHKVGSSLLDAPHGQVDIGIGGEEHHTGLRCHLPYLPEPIKPLVAVVGAEARCAFLCAERCKSLFVGGLAEVHVQQYHIGPELAQVARYACRIGNGGDVLKHRFRKQAHSGEDIAVVIYDE